MNIAMYSIIFIYGILIGSFLNVLVYRIPRHENFTTTRSHCMTCGYQLRWFDLIPLFSYIALQGKCRKCKASVSIQYPLVELINGVAYMILFAVCGASIETILYCLMTSALLALSLIDFRTYEIPLGFNLFIGSLGLIHLAVDYVNWSQYVIGAVLVSGFILLIIIVTKGRGMGGGDCKLMAAVGLLIGWKLSIVAFLAGCILGSVIHLIRMKVSGEDHVLAFGPYLSMGIFISVLYGNQFIDWYWNLITSGL